MMGMILCFVLLPLLLVMGAFLFGMILVDIYFDIFIEKALLGVSNRRERRKERVRQLTALAQTPETSLLRAGEAPTSPPDVLVRPVVERSSTDPEHLLRVSLGD